MRYVDSIVPCLSTFVRPNRIGSEYKRTSTSDSGAKPVTVTFSESPFFTRMLPSLSREITEPSDCCPLNRALNSTALMRTLLSSREIVTGTSLPATRSAAPPASTLGTSMADNVSLRFSVATVVVDASGATVVVVDVSLLVAPATEVVGTETIVATVF